MLKSIITNDELLGKNKYYYKRILLHFLNNGYDTIANISKSLGLSAPTITKLLDEMSQFGLVRKQGKLDTGGGRHPYFYDLNPEACYFAGVDIRQSSASIAIIDLCSNVIAKDDDIPYKVANTPESLDNLCDLIKDFLKRTDVDLSQIINICVNVSGRVNSEKGYSYSMFNFLNKPLADVLSQKVGLKMSIDNDSRSMAYGEYMFVRPRLSQNIIFINVGWGIGIGMIFGGEVYRGKSGFAGEIGHMVTYNNEVMCHCGKKGCLETEASGRALHRKLCQRMDAGENSLIAERYLQHGDITLDDILDAIAHEDLLCLELIEDVGRELGRWLAGIINIFNPDEVIVGGVLSETGDSLLQPISVGMRRYSLNMVNMDTRISLSKLGRDAGVLGACAMARSKAFDEIFM